MTSNLLENYKILQFKYNDASTCVRHIFYKQHTIRAIQESKPSDKTVFCANIPPWMDSDVIKMFFEKYGKIENVFMEFEPSTGEPSKPSDKYFPDERDPYKTGNGFKFAYIVFERSSSVRSCMNSADADAVYTICTQEKPVVTGIKKYIQEYNNQIVEKEVLLGEVQEYMKTFDDNVNKKAEEDDNAEIPDEDGWVTVTGSSKKSAKEKQKEQIEVKKQRKTPGRAMKKKGRELKNFYSHQIKDEKINRIRELRAKFEEDKAKIAKMKADRKFKPF